MWQLPQNIVALCMYPFIGKKKVINEKFGTKAYYANNMQGGISLGNYIYLSYSGSVNKNTINHEFGHVKQSHYLGWLYLIVIGLPSLVWAILHSYTKLGKKYDYYSFYTEKWADKLGGVNR